LQLRCAGKFASSSFGHLLLKPMIDSAIETKYPLAFRKKEAKELGEHLKLRHSVELIGTKRVGISDFLRFFLYRRGIVQKYIERREFHLFISVDLNDLVELEIFPFWILTFKRVNDAVQTAAVSEKLKRDVNLLFLDSIQKRDTFLTLENLRQALSKIVKAKIIPTIFLIRFDRIVNVCDSQFFSNLEGLVDSSARKLAYVFTTFRKIDEIAGEKLSRNFLHVFQNVIYVKPANFRDTKIVFDAFKKRYKISPKNKLEKKLIDVSGGHIQYLHLAIIILEAEMKKKKIDEGEILGAISKDERINLQSEEIWESLKIGEQKVLLKVHKGEKISSSEQKEAQYLWEAGLVYNKQGPSLLRNLRLRTKQRRSLFKSRDDDVLGIFSPLFESFLEKEIGRKEQGNGVDLTKKEKTLYEFLHQNLEKVCEREKIIEAVWPESEELGVSDWTIDRLVARLREKLKNQKSKYQIVTVKTRGFKLIP